ncbi:unnamed protein product, partial [Acanthocheilonema viteae]
YWFKMQILSANDVKIYNLSAGKSIPDWITDRKRRKLEQNDIDLRRRIQLIQDFDMPDISNTITVSPDRRYIFATGTYKPVLKCFDVSDLSLKFSRGLDADVVKMAVLSDDYSKFVLLEEERYVEVHVAYGRYFRMRIPKFGYDMAFCHEVSDLYIVGSGELPIVTSVCFKDALHLGVGASTGHVLLFDIRSNKPLLIKDHQTGLPINKIDFVPEHNLVLSMDMRLLKIWEEIDGKPFAAIEPGSNLSDFCRYPDSGLLFFANEAPKMLQYFVPALGTAPKWCSYLETITEELEETEQPAVYDDYKFVTKEQLEEIGLLHLVGTGLLRAYMHGYFIDIRLYNKAKTFTQPWAYENYKQRKVMEKIDEERSLSTAIRKSRKPKLPSVNKELAEKLLTSIEEMKNVNGRTKRKNEDATSILSDERFGSLFTNPDFQIDESSEQFQLLVSAIKKLGEKRQSLLKKDDGRTNNSNKKVSLRALKALAHLILPNLQVPEIRSMEDLDIYENTIIASRRSDDGSFTEIDVKDEENNVVGKPSMTSDEEGSDDEGMQSAVREKRKIIKPKGFNLIESDIGEDTVQYFKENNANENAISFFAQTEAETMGMKRKVSSEVVGGSKQCIPFGGLEMTFEMKTCGLAAKKECLARKEKEHLVERKEIRRDIKRINKVLKKVPVWRTSRRKRSTE